jgi:hypothetical protein
LAGKKVFIGYLMQHFAHQGVGFNTGDFVAHLLNIQQLNIGKKCTLAMNWLGKCGRGAASQFGKEQMTALSRYAAFLRRQAAANMRLSSKNAMTYSK